MSAPPPSKDHALVFGATGINGWAIVNAVLHDYPTAETFSRVTALSNRPISYGDTLWPMHRAGRLNIVSGIDVMAGSQEDLENTLNSRVAQIDTVTQVFFCGKLFCGITVAPSHPTHPLKTGH